MHLSGAWAHNRPGFERFAHTRKPCLHPCAIVSGVDGVINQLGNLFHPFAQCQSAARAIGLTRDDIECLEHARHDGDIAFGVPSDLVER